MSIKKIKTKRGNPAILGVSRTQEGVNFAVASDTDRLCLNLFKSGKKKPEYTIELGNEYRYGDVFAVEVSGVDFESLEYNYSRDGVSFPDEYAKVMSGVHEFGHAAKDACYKSKVLTQGFEWEEDRPLDIPYEDLILYRIHPRGYTRHSSSGVACRGTFEGIMEKIPYIRELGVNAVEFMPVYEFEEVRKWSEDHTQQYDLPPVDKVNYWGYTTGQYFALKSAYTVLGKTSNDYTSEFKRLVKEFHKNNIEVIVEMYFPQDARINMISECVRYWVLEYHLDGIHINCSEDALKMIANDPLLARTKLFAPYWNNKGVNGSHKNLANYNGAYMNVIRKFLKGDENQLTAFVNAQKNNSRSIANINYISNHNTLSLNDMVSYDRKHNEVNGENNRDGEDFNNSWNCGVEGKSRKKAVNDLRMKQIKNALLMMFLSQGTPLIYGGDEFLNTTCGNNNPYCQDNEISWLNWRLAEKNKDVTEFIRQLIAFRKQHGVLHMREHLHEMDYKALGYPDVSYHGSNAWYSEFESYNRHIGIMYCGKYADDDFIYAGYNMHWEKHTLALPKLPEGYVWKKVLETDNVVMADRKMEMPMRSVVVLVSVKKEIQDKESK